MNANDEKTLAEFFSEFIQTHTIRGNGEGDLVLDITPEEFEDIGRSFVQILTGWAAGLKALTLLRHLVRLRHTAEGIGFDISPQECEALGKDCVQFLVGWAAGLKPSRRRHGITLIEKQLPSQLALVSKKEKGGEL
ncbi:MAG TPA: hypothetical protein VJ302_36930 [Blastocatellia bacterium]|nr:hypothetical protein [Blastocatellia bacterium]